MIRSILSTFRPAARQRDASFTGLEALEPRLALSTIHWDGGGDGVTLTDRFNWECNRLPGIYDHAVIDVAANPAVVHNGGTFKVKKFTLAEQLTVTAGTVSVSSQTLITTSGTFNMAGGLFDGCATLFVNGKLNWTGGKISGGGIIDVGATGMMTIAGSGPLELRRDITNRGYTLWNSGDIEGYDACGTVITNKAGATFKATGQGRFRSNCWPGAFINEGTLVRQGEGEIRLVVPVHNSGAVNVVSGTLQFLAGGTNSGTRHVSQGGILHFYGNFTHAAGSTLTGGGITIWQGGNHTIAGDWTMASFLHVTNATIRGGGTLSIDGPLTWNHGRFEGSGGTIINPTGKISLMTPGQHVLARSITNNGTLIWNNGGFTFDGGTVTNNTDKFFYIQSGATAVATAGTQNLITNFGEMRKQLPTDLGLGGVTLDNQGFVNVRNGSLTLDPAAVAQIDGATLTGGRWSVYGTAVFSFGGLALEAIGAGAFVERIGPLAGFEALNTLAYNAGEIRVSGGGVWTITPAGGTFTNAGTITLRKGTTLRVEGDFVQTAAGAIDIGIASFHSLGTGRMISAQTATLDGHVAFTLQNGYEPFAGNSFLFLEAQTRVGEFSSASIPIITDQVGSLVYLPGGVRLVYT